MSSRAAIRPGSGGTAMGSRWDMAEYIYYGPDPTR